MPEDDQIKALASRWGSYSKEQREHALKLLSPEQKTQLGELRGYGGGAVAQRPKPPVRFNMGTGVMPSPEIAQSERASDVAVGTLSGFPNIPRMVTGGGMAAVFPPKAKHTEVGQGLLSSGAEAVLNKRFPGAGYGARALTQAVATAAGGEAGNAADAAAGNEQQSGTTRGVSAVLSGLLGGFGRPTTPWLEGPAGDSAFVSRMAGDNAHPLARSVNNKLFRSFLKGNKKFAQDTFTAVDQYLDETFEPIAQTDILRIFGKVEAATANTAAFPATLKGLTKSQDASRSSETILRTFFGGEPTQVRAAATVLRENLDPEEYKKVTNAWMTHVFFRDALTATEQGLEGKGSKMLQDVAAKAPGRGTIPYVVRNEAGEAALPYAAKRGGPDFALSGDKLKFAAEMYGKENLEEILGPKGYSVINDVSNVLSTLALDKPREGFRNVIRQGVSGTLRYQGNRLVYIASGIGAFAGAGALAGIMPLAAIGLAGAGAVIGLDVFVQKGLLNPGFMTGLRKAVEAGDQQAIATAFRALMAAEATVPQAAPSTR